MKEIGGYIEMEHNHGGMLHGKALALNCGRRAFSYILRSRKIKRIWLPKLMCGAVLEPCRRDDVEVGFYSTGVDFLPYIDSANLIDRDDWIYIINYYGQIDNGKISELRNSYPNIIVDNAQAFFQIPVEGVDTIYTCRKFFGVADGAFLYSEDKGLYEELETDVSYSRMGFLMGCLEKAAAEFYEEYKRNNELFDNEPIKKMSRLTDNILRGIDYDNIRRIRSENFEYLHHAFHDINKLELQIPDGAFMYPFYIEDGSILRDQLIKEKVYIPTLWPDVFEYCGKSEPEYDMAKNILPLPVDQRYSINEMEYIKELILSLLGR